MIQSLLRPRSVAVVGASPRVASMGHQIFQNLVVHGYSGTVYPVNPRARSVCAVRAYPTLAALPEVPELCIVVVPADRVIEVAQQSADIGVKALAVISSGFRETGPAGAARERQLTSLIRIHGMRMLGPNCMGIINADPAVSMNATFADIMPPFGHAAFVSQSGALGLNVLDHAREFGIGISQFVSIGNKADVSSNDLLLAWEDDPAVRVILMYIESFGNPAKFLEIAGRISCRKPIVIVKAGRSIAGARAANSHTGALASSELAIEALLTQAGVLRAASIEELFDIAMAFESRAIPRSGRTAVLTNAGGPGILAADAMETAGLDLVKPCAKTIESLRGQFPPAASIGNPVDMIASATPQSYRFALTALLADPAIDAVVPIFVPPFGVRQEDVADAIVHAAATAPAKPVYAVLMGREGLPQGRAELHAAGIPAYVFPESAARALGAVNRHRIRTARPPRAFTRFDDMSRDTLNEILSAAVAEHRTKLNELEALRLIQAAGIPVAEADLATTEAEALEVAQRIGYPVVLKVLSLDVVHKTDVGGVRVGIDSPLDLSRAYQEMVRGLGERTPAIRIEGVLVQRQHAHGRELIAGFIRDPAFGPLLMFGVGGIYVEAIADHVVRLAPLDHTDALDMVNGLRATALLNAIRGEPAVNRDALAVVLRRLSQLALDHPAIAEIDLNPLRAGSEGAMALDARIRISA